MITLCAGTSAASGARAFGLVPGIAFVALAGLSIILTARKRRRPKPAVTDPAGLASVLSAPAAHPAAVGPAPVNI